MVYILFFYDMVMTMANVGLCAAFAFLFARRKNALHLWLAILFGLCTVDIVLMYLVDFVPEFQALFAEAPGAAPFAYAYVHLGILLTFRFVAGFIFDRPPKPREAALWIFCCTYLAVAGMLSEAAIQEFAENLCIGLLQLYLMGIGIAGLRDGRGGGGVMGRATVTALVAACAACSVGYLAGAVGAPACTWPRTCARAARRPRPRRCRRWRSATA